MAHDETAGVAQLPTEVSLVRCDSPAHFTHKGHTLWRAALERLDSLSQRCVMVLRTASMPLCNAILRNPAAMDTTTADAWLQLSSARLCSVP